MIDIAEKIKALGDEQILCLGEIVRYNNHPKVHRETVAEHSFYVVTTVIKICKMFDLPDEVEYKALKFATVHDIPEMLTGDVPFDTKVANPLLEDVLEQYELCQLKENIPEFLDLYKEFCDAAKEETIPFLVTDLADKASVLQYSNYEIKLGNRTKQMLDINEKSQKRVAALIEKLESKIKRN